MWLIFLALLTFLTPQRVVAQTPATSAATVEIASPSATPAPTIIPTPTTNPALTTFLQLKNDYLYNFDLYQQAFFDYTQKKQVHTKYNTVTTHNDKIESTKKALIARNTVLRAYFQALRAKLDIYKAADPTNTPKLQIELSKLESWLNEQNTIVSTLNNDDDILSNRDSFKQKYVFVQQIIYASLVQSEYNMRLLTLNQLNSYITTLASDPTINTEGKQWVNSLIIKADNAKSNLNAALDNVAQNRQPNAGKFKDFYPDSKEKLVLASQYCTEIINDIKNILIKFTIQP